MFYFNEWNFMAKRNLKVSFELKISILFHSNLYLPRAINTNALRTGITFFNVRCLRCKCNHRMTASMFCEFCYPHDHKKGYTQTEESQFQ